MLVVGDGTERPNVQRRANDLRIGEGRLQFLGSRSDIHALLAAADFFVLPSDVEGLPMAVLEAMAHGLPVVATAVGGIPEVITDGREGLLVPPGDAAALARAIQRLLTSSEMRLRLGDAARDRVSKEFSLETMANRYQQIYAEATTGKEGEQ